MIDDCVGISALALQAADVLLMFFESRLDFPAGSVVLDNLLDQEGKINSEQGNPLGLAVDPNHSDRTLKCLAHNNLVEGHNLSRAAIEVDFKGLGLIMVLGRHLRGLPQQGSIFRRSTLLFFLFLGQEDQRACCWNGAWKEGSSHLPVFFVPVPIISCF